MEAKRFKLRTVAAALALVPLVACGGAGSEGGTAAPGGGAGGGDDGGPVDGGDNGGSGGDTGGGDLGGGDFDGVDEDEAVDPPAEGSLVGRLELTAPTSERFVVKGTLPIQKGLFPRSDGQSAFALVDSDGTPVASQVEVVTRYPNDADGADVVEILARVTRPTNVAPGSRLSFDVTLSPHAAPDRPATPSLGLLADAPLNVAPELRALVADPNAIVVRTRDVFGHTYSTRPLEGDNARLLRHGFAAAQIGTYDTMLPDTQVSGTQGNLRHALGVHSYMTSWSGEAVLSLDMRFNNGPSTLDKTTSDDDYINDFYFEALEIVVPSGWVIQQAFDDPFFGTPYQEAGKNVFPIVKPTGDNSMHYMPLRAQFQRRLALAPVGAEAEARAILSEEGQAFSIRGRDPVEGHRLYSWWNPITARYFPQSALLPSLDHLGLADVRSRLRDDLTELSDLIANGTSLGGYPVSANVLGWAHPWGAPYGGMTGGNEIWFFDGVPMLASASNAGYRYAQLVNRMQNDRQPASFYNVDGSPSSVEDWLETTANGTSYVPFNFYQIENGSSDPFGIGQMPTAHVQYVSANNLMPAYQDALRNFKPVDFQHYVRFTRSAKTLAWTGNDALAKDDLQHAAEIYNLSFHQHDNSAFGQVQASGLKSKVIKAQNDPGVGSVMGRGEGWGGDSMNAAFATGTPEWRAAKREWFRVMADTLVTTQSECNGFYQSFVINKALDGRHAVRQAIEQYILENFARGMIETAFAGQNSDYAAKLRVSLYDSHYASISELAWSDDEKGPWAWTAVGSRTDTPPAYCSLADMPDPWFEPILQMHLLWSSFSYAYELTDDPVFLSFAERAMNGGELYTELLEDNLNKNLENKAPLLALMQELAGDL